MHPRHIFDSEQNLIFGHVRRSPIWLIVALVGVHVVLKVVFFSDWFLLKIASPMEAMSHGILQPATVAGAVQLFLLVGVGVMVIGRQSPQNVGLRARGLGRIVLLVVVIAIAAGAICAFLGARLSPAPLGLSLLATSLLQATVGSAIPEELFYRGFLLIQVFLVLSERRRGWSVGRCLVVSITIVELYFAASHVPAALRAGLPIGTAALWILQVGLVGGMLSVLFVQTENISMAIGAHTLMNISMPFVESPIRPEFVVLVLVCLTMLGCGRLFGRERIVEHARVTSH